MTELLLIVDMVKNGVEQDNEGSDSYVASDLNDWEPKEGEWIQVRDFPHHEWVNRKFIRYAGFPGGPVMCEAFPPLEKVVHFWRLYKRIDK